MRVVRTIGQVLITFHILSLIPTQKLFFHFLFVTIGVLLHVFSVSATVAVSVAVSETFVRLRLSK